MTRNDDEFAWARQARKSATDFIQRQEKGFKDGEGMEEREQKEDNVPADPKAQTTTPTLGKQPLAAPPSQKPSKARPDPAEDTEPSQSAAAQPRSTPQAAAVSALPPAAPTSAIAGEQVQALPALDERLSTQPGAEFEESTQSSKAQLMAEKKKRMLERMKGTGSSTSTKPGQEPAQGPPSTSVADVDADLREPASTTAADGAPSGTAVQVPKPGVAKKSAASSRTADAAFLAAADQLIARASRAVSDESLTEEQRRSKQMLETLLGEDFFSLIPQEGGELQDTAKLLEEERELDELMARFQSEVEGQNGVVMEEDSKASGLTDAQRAAALASMSDMEAALAGLTAREGQLSELLAAMEEEGGGALTDDEPSVALKEPVDPSKVSKATLRRLAELDPELKAELEELELEEAELAEMRAEKTDLELLWEKEGISDAAGEAELMQELEAALRTPVEEDGPGAGLTAGPGAGPSAGDGTGTGPRTGPRAGGMDALVGDDDDLDRMLAELDALAPGGMPASGPGAFRPGLAPTPSSGQSHASSGVVGYPTAAGDEVEEEEGEEEEDPLDKLLAAIESDHSLGPREKLRARLSVKGMLNAQGDDEEDEQEEEWPQQGVPARGATTTGAAAAKGGEPTPALAPKPKPRARTD